MTAGRPLWRLDRAVAAGALLLVLAAFQRVPSLELQQRQRENLARQIIASGLVNSSRTLVMTLYVCTLTIGHERFGVLDVREIIPKAQTPSGVNRVMLLDDKDHIASSFEYRLARPIACRGNRLVLFGDADPLETGKNGNVVVYGARGRIINVLAVDAGDLWPLR